MKNQILTVAFSLSTLSAFCQNDLGIYAGTALSSYGNSVYNNNTQQSKSLQNNFTIGLAYRRYLPKTTYIKLGHFLNYYSNDRTTDYFGANANTNKSYSKIYGYTLQLEYGKSIRYKFVELLGGANFQFGVRPSYTNFQVTHYTNSDNTNTITNPASFAVGLGLNAGLYFHLHKNIALGLECLNGFYFNYSKGTQTQTNLIGSAPPVITKTNIENHTFSTSFLNMQFGLRFLIPDAVKKKVAAAPARISAPFL